MNASLKSLPLAKLATPWCLAVAVTLTLVNLSAAGTYSTGFENPPFSTGSINAQDGWTATGASYEQAVVNTVAHTGTQSFFRNNNVVSGSFGDQPFSAPLPGGEAAGESTAVGVTAGINKTEFSVWFRAGDMMGPDGSFVSLSATDSTGSRMNYIGIANTDAGGLTLNAYDVTSNGFGNAADFNESSLTATPLDRSTWHELRVESLFVDGPANDVVNYYVDGSLEATIGSLEDYYHDDPEQAGNGNQLYAVDRVWFGTRAAPSAFGFTTGDAQGIYFDDFSVSASAVPEPASFALLGLGLGATLLRRRKRRQ
jgi:PEP-CTERM motif